MREIREQAAALREQALEIVERTKVVEMLSVMGDVFAVGSYDLDLMVRRDIDFCVVNPAFRRDDVLRATNEMLASGHFRTVVMTDTFRFPVAHLPRGYFFELVLPGPGGDWTVDVQGVETDAFSVAPTRRYRRLLEEDPGARELILEIKHHLLDGEQYRHGISSRDIYDAVLEQGVVSVADFVALRFGIPGSR
jgi:DNA polymerase sigma